jgi:NAD(P)-dependent dehydrogenase (short-subunit alcohol dehydrogenase family)
MGRLAGKTAFIAGGTGGIGSATALMFAREGAKVAVGSRRVPEGEELVQQIIAAGGEALHVQMDVTDEKSVEKAVESAVSGLGKLDILINNAGGSSSADGPVTSGSLDEFWRVMKIDLYGTFVGSRFAIPHIVKQGGGSVINMASMAGFGGTVGRDAYTSAKGGVIALTKSMARTWVDHRIRVNAIAPAAVGSDRIRKMIEDSEIARQAISTQKLGLIDPDEIAALATFLGADESRSLTGQIIGVHAGMFE